MPQRCCWTVPLATTWRLSQLLLLDMLQSSSTVLTQTAHAQLTAAHRRCVGSTCLLTAALLPARMGVADRLRQPPLHSAHCTKPHHLPIVPAYLHVAVRSQCCCSTGLHPLLLCCRWKAVAVRWLCRHCHSSEPPAAATQAAGWLAAGCIACCLPNCSQHGCYPCPQTPKADMTPDDSCVS
jgi:hypothetical protein